MPVLSRSVIGLKFRGRRSRSLAHLDGHSSSSCYNHHRYRARRAVSLLALPSLPLCAPRLSAALFVRLEQRRHLPVAIGTKSRVGSSLQRQDRLTSLLIGSKKCTPR